MAMVSVNDEQQEDCFFKMNEFINGLKQEEEKEEVKEETAGLKSRIAILHSRYASRKNTVSDTQAHPVFDQRERVAVFHNGFVTNYKELARELFPDRNPDKSTLSDSELIALMLGKFLDQQMDIKTALKTLVETKLIGTWRIAVMVVAEPNKLYFTKNVGPFYIGRSEHSLVLCSDRIILED